MSNTIDTSSTASATSSSASTTTKKSSSSLSMDDFFTLLSAQLQYQDPLQPTDNSQFMAQMAQFSLLEQVQNMSQTLNMSIASTAMGKYAVYNTVQDNKTVQQSGVVNAVDLTGDSPEYLINGGWVSQSNITQMFDQLPVDNAAVNMSSALAAIGKYAAYSYTDSDGKTVTGNGMVTAVDLSGGSTPMYQINGSWINQTYLTKVSSTDLSGSTTST